MNLCVAGRYDRLLEIVDDYLCVIAHGRVEASATNRQHIVIQGGTVVHRISGNICKACQYPCVGARIHSADSFLEGLKEDDHILGSVDLVCCGGCQALDRSVIGILDKTVRVADSHWVVGDVSREVVAGDCDELTSEDRA